ncbi:MAG: hypothetical protein CMH79_05145, partial [Nitrospinae bacterium]|nr:hypothetical protein [Nitrospinota bacterium]
NCKDGFYVGPGKCLSGSSDITSNIDIQYSTEEDKKIECERLGYNWITFFQDNKMCKPCPTLQYNEDTLMICDKDTGLNSIPLNPNLSVISINLDHLQMKIDDQPILEEELQSIYGEELNLTTNTIITEPFIVGGQLTEADESIAAALHPDRLDPSRGACTGSIIIGNEGLEEDIINNFCTSDQRSTLFENEGWPEHCRTDCSVVYDLYMRSLGGEDHFYDMFSGAVTLHETDLGRILTEQERLDFMSGSDIDANLRAQEVCETVNPGCTFNLDMCHQEPNYCFPSATPITSVALTDPDECATDDIPWGSEADWNAWALVCPQRAASLPTVKNHVWSSINTVCDTPKSCNEICTELISFINTQSASSGISTQASVQDCINRLQTSCNNSSQIFDPVSVDCIDRYCSKPTGENLVYNIIDDNDDDNYRVRNEDGIETLGITITCADGYYQSAHGFSYPNLSDCQLSKAEFDAGNTGTQLEFTGCEPIVCTSRTDATIPGYVIINEEELNAVGFSVRVECASGFRESGDGPKATVCESNNAPYDLSGCIPIECNSKQGSLPTPQSYTLTETNRNLVNPTTGLPVFNVRGECISTPGLGYTGEVEIISCDDNSDEYTINNGCQEKTCLSEYSNGVFAITNPAQYLNLSDIQCNDFLISGGGGCNETTCADFCDDGQMPNDDKTSCVNCPRGTQRLGTEVECAKCRDNYYQPSEGQSSCIECPIGTESPSDPDVPRIECINSNCDLSNIDRTNGRGVIGGINEGYEIISITREGESITFTSDMSIKYEDHINYKCVDETHIKSADNENVGNIFSIEYSCYNDDENPSAQITLTGCTPRGNCGADQSMWDTCTNIVGHVVNQNGKCSGETCTVSDYDPNQEGGSCCIPLNTCEAAIQRGELNNDQSACPAGYKKKDNNNTCSGDECNTVTCCEICDVSGEGPNDSQTLCDLCPAGTSNSGNLGICSDCPAGEYQNGRGRTDCKDCPPGKRSSTTGAFECLSCPENETSLDGINCTPCSDDQYTNPNIDIFECTDIICDLPTDVDALADGYIISNLPTRGTSLLDNRQFYRKDAVSGNAEWDALTVNCDSTTHYISPSSTIGIHKCEMYPRNPGRTIEFSGCLERQSCIDGFTNLTPNIPAGYIASVNVNDKCVKNICDNDDFDINDGNPGNCITKINNCDGARDRGEVICPVGYRKEMNTCSDSGATPCDQATCCVPCGPGTQSSDDQTSCDNCPVGTFNSITSGPCIDCPTGQYQDESGHISCIDCPDGKYQSETGADHCILCAIGTYTPNGSSSPSCDLCPEGQICQFPGTTSLDGDQPPSRCGPGQQPDLDSSDCELCSQGSYSERGAECKECPIGTYQDVTGSSTCKICEDSDEVIYCPEPGTIHPKTRFVSGEIVKKTLQLETDPNMCNNLDKNECDFQANNNESCFWNDKCVSVGYTRVSTCYVEDGVDFDTNLKVPNMTRTDCVFCNNVDDPGLGREIDSKGYIIHRTHKGECESCPAGQYSVDGISCEDCREIQEDSIYEEVDINGLECNACEGGESTSRENNIFTCMDLSCLPSQYIDTMPVEGSTTSPTCIYCFNQNYCERPYWGTSGPECIEKENSDCFGKSDTDCVACTDVSTYNDGSQVDCSIFGESDCPFPAGDG